MITPDISTTVVDGMLKGLALLPISYAQAANENPWMWVVAAAVVALTVGRIVTPSRGRRRR